MSDQCPCGIDRRDCEYHKPDTVDLAFLEERVAVHSASVMALGRLVEAIERAERRLKEGGG